MNKLITAIAITLFSLPIQASAESKPIDYAMCAGVFASQNDPRMNDVLRLYQAQVARGNFTSGQLDDAFNRAMELGKRDPQALAYASVKACGDLGFEDITRNASRNVKAKSDTAKADEAGFSDGLVIFLMLFVAFCAYKAVSTKREQP